MKYIKSVYFKFVILVSILLFSCASSLPPDALAFIDDSGVSTMTTYAHPTSQIKKYRYKVSGDKIIVDVIFTNEFTMKLGLLYDDGYFTEFGIIEDSDSFPAFFATGLMKSLITQILTEDGGSDFLSEMEREVGQKIDEWSATSFVLFILNWDYSNFKNRN